jgi:hypothetical protein
MKKMTPMILVILMLTSFLSAVDIYELQEESNNEETSARAGADPEVSYITSPRETVYVGADATNVLLAMEPINFKAYIGNAGDADLNNLQYTVTVFDSVNGQREDIAKDVSGADLQWANDKAVCSNSCQDSVIAPGDYIDDGESTLKTTAGNVIEWIPTAGDYIVEVRLTSQVLGDPGNDELSIPVSVKDYHDIEVDLTWLDSNGNEVTGAVDGADPVDFKLSVSLAGSLSYMNLRNVSMAVTATGGTVDSSSNFLTVVGDVKTVPVSEDDAGTVTNAARTIIGAEGAINTSGSIVGEDIFTFTPPSVSSDYSISVTIESYDVYDPTDCVSPVLYCERTIAGVDAEDEFNGNNFDSIYGSTSIVHDLTLIDFYLMTDTQSIGEEEGEGGQGQDDSYGFLGGEITTPLSTGTYWMFADVLHTSSSSTSIYDWNVTFTITQQLEEGPVVTELVATECARADYTHMLMGESTDRTEAEPLGVACASFTFDNGDYNVKATATMTGQYDENTNTTDSKIFDMIEVNNYYSFDIEVVNYAPQILTLKATDESVIAGAALTFTAVTFDVEGDELVFTWADSNGDALNCDNADAETSGVCTFTTTIMMVPSLNIVLSVSDGFNAVVETTSVEVLSSETFTASGLSDGFAAVYSLTARTSGLSVSFADGSLDPVEINTCANSPTPVGSVSVSPSTTYDSSVLVSHSITVHYPNDLGVKYLWMEAGNQVISIASGDGDEVDASTSGYTYNFPAGSDMFSPGTTFYLIADECETPEPPTGTITQLTAVAAKGGAVTIAYSYDTMLSGENVRVTVCLDSANCATPEVVYDRVDTDAKSITYASGTHAQVYDVSAQLCNQYSCGAAVSVSVTSDSEVAMVTVITVTIEESGENWVVRWAESSDDADVAGWYVCYNRGEFSASEMEILIDAGACTMVMDGTEATIAKYTTAETTQVHFGIVPHDAVMNIAYGPSTDSILYDRAQDTTNPDDGSTTTDSEASSGVPTWTWGVIGAVVVVAFVVGAFILSRGESEDDDDKEWDY